MELRIREAINSAKKRGINIKFKDLAKILYPNISESYAERNLYYYLKESKGFTKLDWIEKICCACKCSTDYLLGLQECETREYMTHRDSGDDFENIFIMKSGGGAFVRVSYYNKDNSGFISDLSVDKELRCSGIGGELLNMAENIIHNNGKQFSLLKVKKDTWMHEWYERCGYSTLDYDGDFINMIKNLEK